MKDLNLGFMGKQNPPVNTSNIDSGHRLTFNPHGFILHKNKQVGKLSKGMLKKLKSLSDQGWRISQINVHAVVRRQQQEEGTPEACQQSAWDVIIPEIKLQKNSYG